MVVLVVCLLASMVIGDGAAGDDPDGDSRRRLPGAAREAGAALVCGRPQANEERETPQCSLASWLEPTARRPRPRPFARRPSWPSSPARSSTSSAPSSRSRSTRLQDEQREAPGDVQYEIGPREDVNLTLEAATGDAKQRRGRGQTHTPARATPPTRSSTSPRRSSADLIVVGNKGMTGARRFLLGSVPNKVSHHAPCSVIIVRTT